MNKQFGEFDSVEELNAAAAALKEKGDEKSLILLATENGLDEEDVQDYMDGAVPVLAGAYMAAVGKIQVEAKALKISGILEDWQSYIMTMCGVDAELCAAVMKKNKTLKMCMSKLLRYSFEHKVQVSDAIVNATMVTHDGRTEQLKGPLYMGIPNKAECKKIIREYYLG